MGKRAAVVIGVNRTGGMSVLTSPARGARKVGDWLKKEGYEVVCLTDKDKPVTGQLIKKALKKFVTLPAQYEMLLVYFSGHGQWHARADHWLLSGAPIDTSEAINLDGAMDLARYSGIPNVVFISDVCRTIPDSRTGSFVKGIDAFPNHENNSVPSDIDYFKASCESRPAYEGIIDGKPHSLLTYALTSAYTSPDQEMVSSVNKGSKTIQVITNRKLKNYLQPKVNDLLALIGSFSSQQLELNVPSDDNIYISRIQAPIIPDKTAAISSSPIIKDADFTSTLSSPVTSNWDSDLLSSTQITPNVNSPTLTVGQDAAKAIDDGLLGKQSSDIKTTNLFMDFGEAENPYDNSGYDVFPVSFDETREQVRSRVPREDVDHFESKTGFVVEGAEVSEVKLIEQKNASSVDLIQSYDGGINKSLIRVWDVNPAVSIFVKLQDGRSTILACFFGYIGHATFDEDGLKIVSYVPSTNHYRWDAYRDKRKRISGLRALVSLAVEHNTFKIDSVEKGKSLAAKIRMQKSIDPTLGLYAAHAYHQTSDDKEMVRIRRYMQDDLSADLFDVKVLSSRSGDQNNLDTVVPLCPMLTQTWNILRSRKISLPEVLIEAESFLCNSLWTTFQPQATSKILEAIEKGDLL